VSVVYDARGPLQEARPVTLLDAFRALAPCIGQADVDAVRDRAAEVVLGVLHEIARGMRGDAPLLEDALMNTLLRMTRHGPRGVRVGDPDTDATVRFWLAACLRNNYRDLVAGRPVELDPDRPPMRRAPLFAAPRPRDCEDEVVDSIHGARVEAERQVIYAEISTRLAAGLREMYRDQFLRAVAELREMADGTVSLDDVVKRLHPEPDRTLKNRVYKEHQRARDRVLAWVQDQLRQPGITPVRADALRVVAIELRARGSGR